MAYRSSIVELTAPVNKISCLTTGFTRADFFGLSRQERAGRDAKVKQHTIRYCTYRTVGEAVERKGESKGFHANYYYRTAQYGTGTE